MQNLLSYSPIGIRSSRLIALSILKMALNPLATPFLPPFAVSVCMVLFVMLLFVCYSFVVVDRLLGTALRPRPYAGPLRCPLF